jgi:anti-sigma B factor antagonist
VTDDRTTRTHAPPDGLELRISRDEETTELALAGELDLSTTPTVQAEIVQTLEELARAGDMPSHLVIDLQNLTFIDSTGIQVMVGARRRALQHGVDLSLRLGDSPVRRMLSLAGVADFLGLDA